MNRARQVAVQFASFVRRTVAWLGEQWVALFFLSSLVALGVLGLRWHPCEEAYRWIGTGMQILGVGLAVLGLLSLRTFFGLKPLLTLAREWWARRPGWYDHRSIALGTGHMTLDGASMNAHITVKLDRTASQEVRLNALTDAVEALQRAVDEVGISNRDAIDAVRKDLKAGLASTAAEVAKVELKLTHAQTGGITASIVGAFLVLLGTLLTSIPVEIAKAFGSIDPKCEAMTLRI